MLTLPTMISALARLLNSFMAIVLATTLLASAGAAAAGLDDVRKQLTADLQSAQRELSNSETRISRERGQLAQQINAAQNKVVALREKTAATRRLADEKTLSISQIETRLATWQEQSQYQGRLLSAFLNRNGNRVFSAGAEQNLETGLASFGKLLNAQHDRLYPQWQPGKLVTADGQIKDARLLALGPVQWFWLPDVEQSGLVRQDQDMNTVAAIFSGGMHDGLQALYQHATGSITFDPTLSRALLLEQDKETLLQHLQKGGIFVIPILLFALFATVISIIKGLSLYRLPALMPALAERMEAALKDNGATVKAIREQVQGPQAELLKIALTPQTADQRDERLYAALLEQRNQLERWLGAIAMTASVSPLMGLLGTVSGMITTFKLMTLFGTGDANSVSGGIAEALINTELGLVVAIPALLAHALMSRKVKSYFARLENDAVHLGQLPLQTALHL